MTTAKASAMACFPPKDKSFLVQPQHPAYVCPKCLLVGYMTCEISDADYTANCAPAAKKSFTKNMQKFEDQKRQGLDQKKPALKNVPRFLHRNSYQAHSYSNGKYGNCRECKTRYDCKEPFQVSCTTCASTCRLGYALGNHQKVSFEHETQRNVLARTQKSAMNQKVEKRKHSVASALRDSNLQDLVPMLQSRKHQKLSYDQNDEILYFGRSFDEIQDVVHSTRYAEEDYLGDDDFNAFKVFTER